VDEAVGVVSCVDGFGVEDWGVLFSSVFESSIEVVIESVELGKGTGAGKAVARSCFSDVLALGTDGF